MPHEVGGSDKGLSLGRSRYPWHPLPTGFEAEPLVPNQMGTVAYASDPDYDDNPALTRE